MNELIVPLNDAAVAGQAAKPYSLTFFKSVTDRRGKAQKLTADQFAAMLAQPKTYSAKADLPLFNGVTFSGGRTDKDAKSFVAVIGEHDAGDVTIEEAKRCIEAGQLAAHVYSTPSHTPECPRWRVVAFCSEEHPMGDYAGLEDTWETERQLLYVACTRARDHLLVTGLSPGSEFVEDLMGA